jgi:hypothetical protein
MTYCFLCWQQATFSGRHGAGKGNVGLPRHSVFCVGNKLCSVDTMGAPIGGWGGGRERKCGVTMTFCFLCWQQARFSGRNGAGGKVMSGYHCVLFCVLFSLLGLHTSTAELQSSCHHLTPGSHLWHFHLSYDGTCSSLQSLCFNFV